jgi:hypothetical protein
MKLFSLLGEAYYIGRLTYLTASRQFINGLCKTYHWCGYGELESFHLPGSVYMFVKNDDTQLNNELKVSLWNFLRSCRNVCSESFARFGVVVEICSESFRLDQLQVWGCYTFTELR